MRKIMKIYPTIYTFLLHYLRISLEDKHFITKLNCRKISELIARSPTHLLQTHTFYILGFHCLNSERKFYSSYCANKATVQSFLPRHQAVCTN